MTIDFSRLSVLVAEDCPPMRRLIIEILRNTGVQDTNVARNGDQAYDVFKETRPDIVITDWSMDERDGISLTRGIRNNAASPDPLTPIVMITGYAALHRVKTARDAGINEYLIKPLAADDLVKRIAHVINNPRDFIRTVDFFGPDRRRRDSTYYAGPFRRKCDQISARRQTDAFEVIA